VLENLNPRKFLAARIGWAVLAIFILLAPLCAWLIAKQAERYFRQAALQSLQQYAVQIHRELAANLDSRLAVLRLTASQLSSGRQTPSELRISLDAFRVQFPEINWIGLTNIQGDVIAASDNVLLGANVAGLSWFKSGLTGAFIGDVRNSNLLEQLLPRAQRGNQFRVVDIAAPVTDENGITRAVLGAQLSWTWIQNLQALSLSGVGSNTSFVQLILTSEDDIVLSGPEDLLAQSIPDQTILSEQGKYLVGTQSSAHNNSQTLDWTVSVRSESTRATAAGRSTQRFVFITLLLAGTIAASLIVYAISRLTRDLRNLSEGARKIASGLRFDPKSLTATEDISQISQVLSDSISNLQKEKNTLVTLNSELDRRVEDRTNEIKRLSTKSREIALTQQRLRFARDMHDTLAHSMMAVLTQIRLVRKIGNKLSEDEVEDELRRAENVAAKGLKEARAAILEIRADNVQGKGISAALYELAERFRARSGLQFSLHINPDSLHQEDQRSETIYRIVEEALRNIEKHAKAQSVRISLDPIEQLNSNGKTNDGNTAATFKLQISDDGIGFNTEQVASGHYGLIGLREQAALIDGELTIESEPGNGCEIVMTYPAYAS